MEEAPTLEESLQAQASGLEGQATPQTVVFSAFSFTYDHDVVLVRQVPVSRALHKYLPVALRVCILYRFHYPIFTKQPRQRRLYNTIRHHFFWCIRKTTCIRQSSIAAHAPNMDVKWGISVIVNYPQQLEHLIWWAIIYSDHYRSQRRVINTCLLWPTIIHCVSVQFPPGKFRQSILQLNFSTIDYSCMINIDQQRPTFSE